MPDINLNAVFKISDNLITKSIEDELVIVTTSDGLSNIDSSIYSLNPTGKVIWEKIDGHQPLKQIIEDIVQAYDASYSEVEKDVIKIIKELLEKKLILIKN